MASAPGGKAKEGSLGSDRSNRKPCPGKQRPAHTCTDTVHTHTLHTKIHSYIRAGKRPGISKHNSRCLRYYVTATPLCVIRIIPKERNRAISVLNTDYKLYAERVDTIKPFLTDRLYGE